MLRELNGQKIVNSSALQVAVSQIAPGSTICLGILRDSKPETLKVTVGEYHGSSEVADDSPADAPRAASSAWPWLS